MTTFVPCAGCRNLRHGARVAPIRLALDADASSVTAVTDALSRWITDSEREEEAFIEHQRQQWAQGDSNAEAWTTRPVAHAWCARSSSVAGICEVINLLGDCADRVNGDEPKLGCGTCAHLQRRPVLNADPYLQLGDGAAQILRDLYGQLDAEFSAELHDALAASGYVRGEVRQLPNCRRLSDESTVVVGPIVNRSDSCTLHSSLTQLTRSKSS